MGASNFGRSSQASSIFAVWMNVEEKFVKCNECEEKHWEFDSEYEEIEAGEPCDSCGEKGFEFGEETRALESYEIEEGKGYMISQLEEKLGFSKDETCINSSRSNSMYNLAEKTVSKFYGDIEVSVQINVFYEVGYHEGARLDFDFAVHNGYEHEYISDTDVDSSLSYLFESSDHNVGWQKIMAKKALKWVNAVIEEYKGKVNPVLAELSGVVLEEVARFSNGETIYKQISK